MAEPKSGRCRLCGSVGVLSREHVIPRSALNAGSLSVHSLYSISRGWSRGEIFQNGLTRATLCGPCNNACGRHYVRPFAHWTLQGSVIHQRLTSDACVLLPFYLVPLAVIKQLAVMTLAMSHAESIDLPPFLDLRRFAISPSRRQPGLPFRFYAYFHKGPPVFESMFYAVSTRGGPCPMVHCHVGREPFGYVVTADDHASVEWAGRLRLCDLTSFADRERNVVAAVHLWIPFLRGELPFRPRQLPPHSPKASKAEEEPAWHRGTTGFPA